MSLIDVAGLACVSVATASRVLSGSNHPVSKATRQRVLDAAKQLGYTPNFVARALVTQRTHILGVILGDIGDPYFSVIVRGIQDMAREYGYLTVVCNSDRVPETELNYVKMLRDHRMDGLIFAGGALTKDAYLDDLRPVIASMRERGQPIVGIGKHDLVSARVDIDNAGATREMTEYLIGLGHRDIAFIQGPEGLVTSSIRLNAFKETLGQHGIARCPDLLLEGDFTMDGGLEATTYLLEQGLRPTAIFGANDQAAIGALIAIHNAGLKVPADISVVGFDDISAARYVHPSLTTIRVPMYEMGIAAVQCFLALAQQREADKVRILPHELIVRESSSPPRARELVPGGRP